MRFSRRQLLLSSTLGLLSLTTLFVRAQTSNVEDDAVGNFRYIYADPELRSQFYLFLSHVFHLYPEKEFHALIQSVSLAQDNDFSTYQQLQLALDELSPFLSDLRYALPALSKQKRVMAQQTHTLLAGHSRFEGYLEVGSTGRYVDALEEVLDIQGPRYFMSERASSYSPVDMIDRGQIVKAGEWLALNDYQSTIKQTIPDDSLDLAAVYIGFHHCPPDLRESFIGSIRDALTVGGHLILRDHNVHNQQMRHLVALAHDVFNMGTKETWQYNSREQRYFYSIAALDKMMARYGFKPQGQRLRQEGDPTLNTLMHFVKV